MINESMSDYTVRRAVKTDKRQANGKGDLATTVICKNSEEL